MASLARVVASGYLHHVTQRGNRRQPMRCIYWPPARYIENNPVRSGLYAHSEDWPWSSARAHLNGEDDALVQVSPMLALVSNWREYLSETAEESFAAQVRAHTRTGRPLGAMRSSRNSKLASTAVYDRGNAGQSQAWKSRRMLIRLQ